MEFPDVWNWICSLKAPAKWPEGCTSLLICASPATPVSMSFFLTTSLRSEGSIHFSLITSVKSTDPPIYLWKSDPYPFPPPSLETSMQQRTFPFLLNALDYIIRLGPEPEALISLPVVESPRDQLRLYLAYLLESPQYKTIFNCIFMCLCLCICVMEAPTNIRSSCLEVLEPLTIESCHQLSLKIVLEALSPSNIDEPFMRSMGLMITHRMMEKQILPLKDSIDMWEKSVRTPFTYSSSSFSRKRFWKVRLYAPLLSMKPLKMSKNTINVKMEHETPIKDRALLCALRYQQAEATIELRYAVDIKSSYIDVDIHIDNVRCVVSKLVSAAVIRMHNAPSSERHFPSKIIIYLAPQGGYDIQMVRATRSFHYPVQDIVTEQTTEEQYVAPRAVGVSNGYRETNRVRMRPWRHEQSVDGRCGQFQWTLYDPTHTKEMASYKPTKMTMLMQMPNSWFRDRSLTATVPLTKEGGVVCGKDENPHSITWRFSRNMQGKTIRWKLWGQIWVTYLPNRYLTFYSETRSLDYYEVVDLPLVQT